MIYCPARRRMSTGGLPCTGSSRDPHCIQLEAIFYVIRKFALPLQTCTEKEDRIIPSRRTLESFEKSRTYSWGMTLHSGRSAWILMVLGHHLHADTRLLVGHSVKITGERRNMEEIGDGGGSLLINRGVDYRPTVRNHVHASIQFTYSCWLHEVCILLHSLLHYARATKLSCMFLYFSVTTT